MPHSTPVRLALAGLALAALLAGCQATADRSRPKFGVSHFNPQHTRPLTTIHVPERIVVELPDDDIVTLEPGDYQLIGSDGDGAYWICRAGVTRSQNDDRRESGGVYLPTNGSRRAFLWVRGRDITYGSLASLPDNSSGSSGAHSAAYVGDLPGEIAARLADHVAALR